MIRAPRLLLAALVLIVLVAAAPAPANAADFPDVAPVDSYAVAVAELASRGIIRGYPDGRFYPEVIVERRHAAVTLVRAMGQGGRAPASDFPDRDGTDEESWKAVRIMGDDGVMRGYQDGTIRPADPLTRQQALSIIARAMVASGIWTTQADTGLVYGDVHASHRADVATYYRYAGAAPGTGARMTPGIPLGAGKPAERGWYAEALWPAVRARERAPAAGTPAPAASTASAATFGMTAHFMWHDLAQSRAELDRMRAAGFTTVRFDLGWRWVEPQRKGAYDESVLRKLDAIFAEVDAHGMAPIVTVIETPAWARPANTGIFAPPTNAQDYADVVGMIARRYAARPGVIWEVWNEPNLVEFWETGPDAIAYTDLLKRAYRAIKAADPDATVLGGSIVFGDAKFLRGMYAAGAAGHFDHLAIHPYTGGRDPSDDSVRWFGLRAQLADLRATLVANGDGDKALYVTEFGWSTDDVSDEVRAGYMRDAVAILRATPGVRNVCAYTIGAGDFPGFGLVSTAGEESRSWQAYAAAAGGR